MSLRSTIPGIFILITLVLVAKLIFHVRPSLRRAVLQESSSNSFIPQLEGLRGLMAMAIVVHHAVLWFVLLPRFGTWGNPNDTFYTELGYFPVLVFFALTGFLFWSKLLKQPHFAPVPFLQARFRRLAPVYLFSVALIYLWVAVLSHFRLRVPLADLLISCSRWLAFAIFGEANINGVPETALLISGTPWTLAFEWLFYLLLLLLPWFARRTHRSLYLLLLAFCVYRLFKGYFLNVTLSQSANPLLRELWTFSGHIAFSFGIGILTASLLRRYPSLPILAGLWISLLCLVLLGTIFYGRARSFFDPIMMLRTGVIFAAIVYGNSFFGLLTSKPVLTLGRISYSVYLCHGLVMSAIYLGCTHLGIRLPVASIPVWLETGAICIFALVLSALCHEWVEAPFLAKRKDHTSGLPSLHRSNL